MEARATAAPTIFTRPDTSRRLARVRAAAWLLWITGIVFCAVAFVFILATFSVEIPSRGFGFRGWVPLVALLWVTIGARIAARQPRNSVGWLLLACGWLWSVNGMLEEYATFAYYPQEIELPFVEPAVWFISLVGTMIAGLSALALLVVPDGKLPSRRWVIIAVAALLVTAVAVLILATLPRRLAPFPFQNPFGIEALRPYDYLFPTVLRTIDVARGLAVLVPTAALLSRLRSSSGERREQLKWVALPAVFASVAVFLYALFDHPLVEYAQLAGLFLIPMGFAIAMRRYRLYDVDQILNRAIVIGGTTALLAGVYSAGIGLMQRIFIALTGEKSDAAVVLTTLFVAAAFTPVRDRLQTFVKRNFGGEIPGTRGLHTFTQEIDNHLKLSDRGELLSQLIAECVSSLGATCGALEVAIEGKLITERVIGPWKGDTHLATEVHSHGQVVARLLLGPRMNAYPYDRQAEEKLGRAAAVVGMALDRIPTRSLSTPV